MPSPKPVANIRRPPLESKPRDVNRFVSAEADVQTSEHPNVSASARPASVVRRRDGRTRRRMTVYLPPDLARKLELHCVTQNRELSEAVTEAVTQLLG